MKKFFCPKDTAGQEVPRKIPYLTILKRKVDGYKVVGTIN